MDKLVSIYLIRHGEVEQSYHNVFAGRLDIGLSDLGHSQACLVASWLMKLKPTHILSSPLKRAIFTAQPLASSTAIKLEILPELREIDFGLWTGLHWDEVLKRFGISAYDWLEALTTNKIPQAEPIDAFFERINKVYNKILSYTHNCRLAVFSHGGVIRGLISKIFELPLPKLAYFQIDYGSITEISYESKRGWQLCLLNFKPWNTTGKPS